MAVDRLYLICKNCGRRRLLFKYWGGGFAQVWKPEELEDFVNEHISCSPVAGFDLGGDTCFLFETENSDMCLWDASWKNCGY